MRNSARRARSSHEWPTFAEAEALTAKASIDGFLLNLFEIDGGWGWVWKHEASGMTFGGDCDAHSREVAIVCALQAVPVVIISVDATTVEPQ